MPTSDYQIHQPIQLKLPIVTTGSGSTSVGGIVPITPTVDPDGWNARPYPLPDRDREMHVAGTPASTFVTEIVHRVTREFEHMCGRLHDAITAEVNCRIAQLEDRVELVLAHQHQLEHQYAILTKLLSELLSSIKETTNDTERGRRAGEGSEERPVLYGGCDQGPSPMGPSDAVGGGISSEIPGYDPSAVSGAV